MKKIALVVGNEGRAWLERWRTQLASKGFEIHVFRVIGRHDRIIAPLRLRSFVKKNDISVVWAWFATTGGIVAALSGVRPYVLTVLGSDVLAATANPIRHLTARVALGTANVVTTTTPVTSDFRIALDRLGVDQKKVVSANWGIDRIFSPGMLERHHEIVDKLIPGLDSNCPLILSLRDVKPYYRQRQILDSFAVLAQDMRALRLAFLLGNGDSSYFEELRQHARTLGVEHSVSFIREFLSAEEMRALYSRADVGVSIPVTDRVGGPVVEFVSCGGRRLVLSDLPSYHEILGEEPGIHYVQDFGAPLTRALRASLVEDSDIPESLGVSLRDLFSWERASSTLVDVFHSVAAKGDV